MDIQQGFKASMSRGAPSEPQHKTAGAGLEVDTALASEFLVALNEQLLSWPEGFTVHPKLRKQLERRRAALGPEGGIDWAHAEALALASLLTEGVPIRLTGQDTERGTFSQRHLVLHDVDTGERLAPIQRLPGALAPLELHNSPLSELATLGFEYGYSAAAPEALVLWEAQFGDFINGAQVIVDQFLSSGLSKWGLTTRLTLLLPHGYEGQGPEHSSARLERFLQLAAEGNIRVANPTTPAQYFHLLRRQARRDRQRPLIVMTPKSLLRLPQASSRLEDLSEGRWHPVLDDPWAAEHTEEITPGRALHREGLLRSAVGGREGVRTAGRRWFGWSSSTRSLDRGASDAGAVPAAGGARVGAGGAAEHGRLDAISRPSCRSWPPTGSMSAMWAGPSGASPAEGYPAAHAAEQGRIIRDALDGTRRPPLLPPMALAGDGKG